MFRIYKMREISAGLLIIQHMILDSWQDFESDNDDMFELMIKGWLPTRYQLDIEKQFTGQTGVIQSRPSDDCVCIYMCNNRQLESIGLWFL